jgi:hypothetical protein
VSAISHHLMKNKDLEYRNGKLIISCNRWDLQVNCMKHEICILNVFTYRCLWNSLSHALGIFRKGKFSGSDTSKLEDQAPKSEVCTTRYVCSLSLEQKLLTTLF